jgi:glucosamine--fructose-6-phosphate aminotransferase (isomerizing)
MPALHAESPMSLMRDEVLEAPDAVARCLARNADFAALGARLRALDPAVVMVCARGSSGHAGTYLRYLLSRDLGVVAAAAMPSIASLYKRQQRLRGAVFVAISQSGRSPDLIASAEAARAAGALTLALVNDEASPLAAACEAALGVKAGPERSVAATKSVLATLAGTLALTAAWTGDATLAAAIARLPERLAGALPLDWSALGDRLARSDRMFTVGRGPGLAVASEAALKLAETDGIAGLAYSSAELPHGPRTLAGPDFPVLGFVQDDAGRDGTTTLLSDLAARGTPVLAAGANGPGVGELPTVPPDHPDTDLLPQLASFYLAAEAAARARGRDPDHPPGLAKVTRTI